MKRLLLVAFLNGDIWIRDGRKWSCWIYLLETSHCEWVACTWVSSPVWSCYRLNHSLKRVHSMFLYITLFSAVGFEVAGTMLLPITHNFSKPFPSALLLLAYGLSFYLLSLVTGKLPLSVIYATWAGLGVFSVAILSSIFYKQALNWQSVAGLFLIVVGVTIVNIYKT